MNSSPTHHLGHVPLLGEQPAKSSVAMLGPRDRSWGAFSGPRIQEHELGMVGFPRAKGLFCGMLGAWAGALGTRTPESGTSGSQGLMDSRIPGAAGLREYQAGVSGFSPEKSDLDMLGP